MYYRLGSKLVLLWPDYYFYFKIDKMKKIVLLALFSMSVISSFAQVDLDKGLMLYLPFNGNTLDESANGNHAKNYGATLTADQWGNPNSAYRFNGKSDYMRIYDDPTLSTRNFTICARVNMMAFYDDICYNNVILSKGRDRTMGSYSLRTTQVTTGDCYYQDTTKHNYRCDVESINTTLPALRSTPYIKTNNWDCLIGIYDDDTVKVYVNGTFRYQYYQPSKRKNNDDLYIGKLIDEVFWFNGVIDEVRIYNRALNTLEIDSICSGANPKLSINEYISNQALPILTNPVSEELKLALSPQQLGGRLTVMDLTGRILIDIPYLNQTNIPLNGLAPGTYIVNYILGTDFMKVKMIKE